MKLLLIDDHALFREGVAALVEQRMPDVALQLAGDLNGARSVLAEHPDCRLALLDLGLPDSHGLDGIARLRELALAKRAATSKTAGRKAVARPRATQRAKAVAPRRPRTPAA